MKSAFPVIPAASFLNPALLWADLAMKTTEMLISSGQVIGTRVDQMARAGATPSARDRKEFALMGSEKVRAATESGLAIAARLQSMNGNLWLRAWQQWFASATAMMSLASSKTMGQAVDRQAAVYRSMARSAGTASQLSNATARLAHSGLAPVHRAATANARRLRGQR
jgi:hypothetical protein